MSVHVPPYMKEYQTPFYVPSIQYFLCNGKIGRQGSHFRFFKMGRNRQLNFIMSSQVPKSSAIGKGATAGGNGGRKTSLDGSQHQDDGVLLACSGSKMTLQYRSLPRPAKSSSGAAGPVASVAGRGGHRSSSSSIDSSVSGKSASVVPPGSAGPATLPNAKRRDAASKVGSGRSSPVTVNQTDKEKVAVSDQEGGPGGGAGLSTSPKSSPTSGGQSGLRQPGSKYPDIASPTFRR